MVKIGSSKNNLFRSKARNLGKTKQAKRKCSSERQTLRAIDKFLMRLPKIIVKAMENA
jgi:hypothetical protein